METQWTSIFLSVITLLSGGTAIWTYFEKRARMRLRDADFIRTDCKDRIIKLESLLQNSANEKDDLRELVLKLTSEVAELRVKVEYLTQENNKLNKKTKKKRVLNG